MLVSERVDYIPYIQANLKTHSQKLKEVGTCSSDFFQIR